MLSRKSYIKEKKYEKKDLEGKGRKGKRGKD